MACAFSLLFMALNNIIFYARKSRRIKLVDHLKYELQRTSAEQTLILYSVNLIKLTVKIHKNNNHIIIDIKNCDARSSLKCLFSVL